MEIMGHEHQLDSQNLSVPVLEWPSCRPVYARMLYRILSQKIHTLMF